MKTFFPSIVGNDALCRRVGAEIQGGTLSHAYILQGQRGSGKHTLALQMAMAAACENKHSDQHPLPCGTCRLCKRIASGNCPDVIKVQKEPDKATFGVNVIRALRSGIATVPNDLDVKFYVIEDAHLMTEEAQNAFLLTLEEPPAFVVFLLLCEDADALLETVRSRAPILRMLPVKEQDIRTYLLTAKEATAAGAPALAHERPEEFATLITLAHGSIGRALSLLDAELRAPLMQQREFATKVLNCLAMGNRGEELLHLFLSLGTARRTIAAELSMLLLALRDLALLSRSETATLLFFADREEATELCTHFTVKRLLALSSATENAQNALLANANVRITLAHLLSQFL